MPPAVSRASSRLVALDAFRGAAILLMVLVNNGGGPRSYAQLEHSAWHGWTLTDTVFPSFLWIVGVAITLSLGKRLEAGMRPRQLLPQILRRAAILYIFGFLLYLPPAFELSHSRLLGVLQRIAICYLVVSCLYLFTGIRTQILVIAGLLLVYTLLMTYYPVPGYGAGHLDMERNFAHYVDRLILGAHNYAHTKSWDPEGIVSTLPAIATTLLGVMGGYLLRLRWSLQKRISCLTLTGVALLVAALLWNPFIPINKKLWTGSFALWMAGLDFIVLAAFLWAIDLHGYKKVVKPLVVVGMNSIAIYLASEVFAIVLDSVLVVSAGKYVTLHRLLYGRFFAPLGSVENASLLWALSFTFLMYLLAYMLYRKSWFWRI